MRIQISTHLRVGWGTRALQCVLMRNTQYMESDFGEIGVVVYVED